MTGILALVGFGWAAIGVGNVVSMSRVTESETALAVGLVFNMVLFILPGLILGAVSLQKRGN